MSFVVNSSILKVNSKSASVFFSSSLKSLKYFLKKKKKTSSIFFVPISIEVSAETFIENVFIFSFIFISETECKEESTFIPIATKKVITAANILLC